MAVAVRTTAVGVFFDPKAAEQAVEDLGKAGFRPEQIGVAVRQPAMPTVAATPHETKAEEGGVAGVFAGGVLGGLLGAGAVAAGLVPVAGPVLAAGVLAAAAASGATAGAVAGGLIGALIGMGIPEDEAHYYHQELEAGRTIVTVRADDRYDQAVAILRRHGAYGKGSPLI